MRMTYIFLGSALIVGLAFYITSRKGKKLPKEQETVRGHDTSDPSIVHTKTNTFNDLRNMAFSVTPEQLQLSLPSDKTIVYGVIMDWGIDTATATVVSYQTGDASLYLSSGGGVIGGVGHPNVNISAKHLVNLAQTFLDKAIQSETNSLPDQDEVKFYLLTNKGRYFGQEDMRNFENSTSTWLPLFDEANKVLTALRMSTEGKK